MLVTQDPSATSAANFAVMHNAAFFYNDVVGSDPLTKGST